MIRFHGRRITGPRRLFPHCGPRCGEPLRLTSLIKFTSLDYSGSVRLLRPIVTLLLRYLFQNGLMISFSSMLLLFILMFDLTSRSPCELVLCPSAPATPLLLSGTTGSPCTFLAPALQSAFPPRSPGSIHVTSPSGMPTATAVWLLQTLSVSTAREHVCTHITIFISVSTYIPGLSTKVQPLLI